MSASAASTSFCGQLSVLVVEADKFSGAGGGEAEAGGVRGSGTGLVQ